MKKRTVQLLGVTLSVLMFLSQSVFAHSLETNFWSERRSSLKQKLVLPPVAPQRAEKISPLATPTIVQIQDVHSNVPAQRSIGQIVSRWAASGAIDVIALEGAATEIDLSRYQAYHNRHAVSLVADYLLREGKISGPVAALMNLRRAPSVVGLEDRRHYAANVAAYLTARPFQDSLRRGLVQQSQRLAQQKQIVFNPVLRAVDAELQSYRDGKLSLKSHLDNLSRSVAPPVAVRQYLAAAHAENLVNLKEAEGERSTLMNRLAERVQPQELETLLHLEPAEFCRRLAHVCERNQISLDDFPAFHRAVRAVLLAGEMDAPALMREVSHMEQEALRRATRSNPEKKLLAADQLNQLQQKLVTFTLSADEWLAYQVASDHAPAFKVFERFYQEAEVRNEAMANNLIQAMQQHHARNALVVTGGFHAERMKEIFAAHGFKTLTVLPTLTSAESSLSSSLDGLLSRKTLLEWIASTWTLAPRPGAPSTLRAGLPLTLGTDAALTGDVSPSDLARSADELGLKANQVRVVSAAPNSAQLEILSPRSGASDDVSVQVAGERLSVQELRRETGWGKLKSAITRFASALKSMWTYQPLRAPRWLSLNKIIVLLLMSTMFDPLPLVAGQSGRLAPNEIVFVVFAISLFIFVAHGLKFSSERVLVSPMVFARTLAFAGIFVLALMSPARFKPTAVAKLAWDANKESNLAGYRLFVQNSAGELYVNDVGKQTHGELPYDPEDFNTFWATAYNDNGLESDPSLKIGSGNGKMTLVMAYDVEDVDLNVRIFRYTHLVGEQYRFEESTDLINWAPSTVERKEMKVSPESDYDNVDTVEVVVTRDGPLDSKMFYRALIVNSIRFAPGVAGLVKFISWLFGAPGFSRPAWIAAQPARQNAARVVYPMLGSDPSQVGKILRAVVRPYLEAANGQTIVLPVAENAETLRAANEWIARAKLPNTHAILPSDVNRMTSWEEAARTFVDASTLRTADVHTYEPVGSSLDDHFMDGIPESEAGRYRRFKLYLNRLLGAFTVEVKPGDLENSLLAGLRALINA